MDYPLRDYKAKPFHQGLDTLGQTICHSTLPSEYSLIYFSKDVLLLILNALKGESVESLVPLRLSCKRFSVLIPPISDIAIRICELAAGHGFLGLLQWGRLQGARWLDTCNEAALNGHMHVLEWAHAQGQGGSQIYSAAALGNQIPIIHWAKAKGYPVISKQESLSYQGHNFFVELVKLGNLEALKWAFENGFSSDVDLCNYAAESGQLDMLKFLRSVGHTWDASVTRHAASKGHFEMLKWAIGQGCPIYTGIMGCAAFSGQVEILDWLVETQAQALDDSCVWAAARGGHLPLLQELVKRGQTLVESISSAAVASGNLKLVQWVHAQGRGDLKEAVNQAVEEGHLHIVQWLLQNDYSPIVSVSAVENAGDNGHVNELLWLLKNNCTLETNAVNTLEQRFLLLARRAVEWNNPELLEFLSHKVKFDESVTEETAIFGRLEILKWLRSLNPPCPWSDDLYWTALRNDHLEVIMWAFKNGCPADTQITDHLFTDHPIERLQWVIKKGFPWNTALIFKAQERGGNYVALSKWLVEINISQSPTKFVSAQTFSEKLSEWDMNFRELEELVILDSKQSAKLSALAENLKKEPLPSLNGDFESVFHRVKLRSLQVRAVRFLESQSSQDLWEDSETVVQKDEIQDQLSSLIKRWESGQQVWYSLWDLLTNNQFRSVVAMGLPLLALTRPEDYPRNEERLFNLLTSPLMKDTFIKLSQARNACIENPHLKLNFTAFLNGLKATMAASATVLSILDRDIIEGEILWCEQLFMSKISPVPHTKRPNSSLNASFSSKKFREKDSFD